MDNKARTLPDPRGENYRPNFFELPNPPKVSLAADEYIFQKDIAARRLWFNVDVEPKTSIDSYDSITLIPSDIVHHILQYNRDDEGRPIEKRTPIKLYLNTYGGDVYEGFSLVDAILTSETPVYTYNMGMCASMGFMIYIAGHKRFTLPHAIFVHHEGQTGDYDSTGKFLDVADFVKRHNAEVVKSYVLAQTKITDKTFTEHARTEWYMLPEDAIELGVAHHIAKSITDIL